MADPLPWIDAEDLLVATGAKNLTRSGNEFSFSCFGDAHVHGDSTPSAGMNVTSTLWRCRNPACGIRGNAVDYLVHLKGFTASEAMRVLSERYGGPEQSVEAGALMQEVERIRAMAQIEQPAQIMLTEDEYLDRFGVHWPERRFIHDLGTGSLRDLPLPMQYMFGRGFRAEILNEWGIGYDDFSDRITIPVHDETGQLVGIKGRAWQDVQPRYISIGDVVGRYPRYGFHTYMKSQYVFGLNRVESSRAVLCEGELNVIALAQMGIEAVAVAGAEFSERQAQLIISKLSEAVIYFDPDAAGRAGTERVAQALDQYMPIYIVQAQGDAAKALEPTSDYGPAEVRAWIDGAQSLLATRLGS